MALASPFIAMSELHTVIANHNTFQLLLDRMHVLALAPGDILPRRRWCRLLAYEIEGFKRALNDHMKAEESGGYMHEIVDQHPEMARKAARLEAEHAALSGTLDNLLAACNAQDDPGQVRATMRDLLDAIATHEREETDLIQEALQRDAGPAD